jgi:hypothetical protein
MANTLFDSGRQGFLDGDISWTADTIRVMLVDHGVDTPVPGTDVFFSDIAAGARVGNSGGSARADMPALAGKTSTDGVADANDTTFTTVPAGPSLESVVGFKDSGADGTSPLIFFDDVATNLPITPNGGDIVVNWDSGPNRIFKL